MSERVPMFGRRCRLQREKMGISVTGLANMVGVSKGFISNMERNGSVPNVYLALRIADALSVPVHWLADWEYESAPLPFDPV